MQFNMKDRSRVRRPGEQESVLEQANPARGPAVHPPASKSPWETDPTPTMPRTPPAGDFQRTTGTTVSEGPGFLPSGGGFQQVPNGTLPEGPGFLPNTPPPGFEPSGGGLGPRTDPWTNPSGGGYPRWGGGPGGDPTGPGFGNMGDFMDWYETYVTGGIANPSRYDSGLVREGTEVIEAALDRMRDKGKRSVGEWAASRGLVGSSLEGERVSDLEAELMRLAEERMFQLGREQANTFAQDRASAMGFGQGLAGRYNQRGALDLENRRFDWQTGTWQDDHDLRRDALDSSNQLGYQQWLASLLMASPELAGNPAFMEWLMSGGGFGGSDAGGWQGDGRQPGLPPGVGEPPAGEPGGNAYGEPPGERPGDRQGRNGVWIREVNGQPFVWDDTTQQWLPRGGPYADL